MDITQIAKSITFKGEVYTKEKLQIDGVVFGTIKNDHEVIISETAEVKANFDVQEIKISGKINGNIDKAVMVHLNPSANFTGDITCKEIKIDKGAVLNGSLIMHKNKN